jgi:hypothetical protein
MSLCNFKVNMWLTLSLREAHEGIILKRILRNTVGRYGLDSSG